ncbi:MAG: TIGR02452 family protein [Bacteroidales bacterium]|nr:TIGR02452 family protein [Bacteroidales bacterium]
MLQKLRDGQFANTLEVVAEGGYVTEGGIEVRLPDDSTMMDNSMLYSGPTDFVDQESHFEDADTVYEVINNDCMSVTEHLVREGYYPALLNLANGQRPGAGPVKSNTQEEAILRRTNLFRSLYQFESIGLHYGVSQRPERYPLDERWGGVYTPDVVLFREGEPQGYKLKEDPVSFAVITVAAVCGPELIDDTHMSDRDAETTRCKIRTILRIGYLHRHDALVLGAFGCGAFGNPPSHMARLFRQVLEEEEFQRRFKKVVFAIIEDVYSGNYYNPDGNFKPFFDEFIDL